MISFDVRPLSFDVVHYATVDNWITRILITGSIQPEFIQLQVLWRDWNTRLRQTLHHLWVPVQGCLTQLLKCQGPLDISWFLHISVQQYMEGLGLEIRMPASQGAFKEVVPSLAFLVTEPCLSPMRASWSVTRWQSTTACMSLYIPIYCK